MKIKTGILLLGVLLLPACRPSAAVPEIGIPTLTIPAPTITPSPSFTSTPVTTLTATNTFIPWPEPLVERMGDVVFSENFDDMDLGSVFGIYGPYRIESNTLVMEREEGYQQPPEIWVTGGMYGQVRIPPDITSILLFMVKRGTTFHIGYSGRNSGTGESLDFHFNSGFATWELHGGASVPVELWHAQQPKTEVWYYFSIKHLVSGEVKAAMWERDNPESRIEFEENLGSAWATLNPAFYIHYRDGAVILDEYQELKLK